MRPLSYEPHFVGFPVCQSIREGTWVELAVLNNPQLLFWSPGLPIKDETPAARGMWQRYLPVKTGVESWVL
jgi:hypothetical protein